MYTVGGDEGYVRSLVDDGKWRRDNVLPSQLWLGPWRSQDYWPKLADFENLKAKDSFARVKQVVKHYPLTGWLLSRDKKYMVEALERTLWGNSPKHGMGGYEKFPYMYMGAEQFTDRIFLLDEPIATAYLGGLQARNRQFPGFQVSWEGLDGDFAALVLDASPSRLKIAAVDLRGEPREGSFRVWQLEHGEYEITAGPDADDDGEVDAVVARKTMELARMDAVPVSLRPRKQMIYELRQVKRLDSIFTRPDLAIGPDDVAVQGNAVRVTVHNIGAAHAAETEVALLDAAGKTLAAARVEALEAPLDFQPRTATVELPRTADAVAVAVDPANAIRELTERNNRVSLPVAGRDSR